MIFNHLTKRRMVDGVLYDRRMDAALLTLGITVLIVGIAVVAFIWAHPVL